MTALPRDDAVRHALRRCRAIARRQARNFYWGMRLAPRPKREAIYVLYAWMRAADDLADDSIDKEAARASLRSFAERTKRALEGECPADEHAHLWLGLRLVRERFAVSAAHFQSMIDGQLHDLDHDEFETFDELRRYCEQVASSVGLLCIQIWGAREPNRAAALASERGVAFQVTNVLRDFAEDYDRGRIYLPAEDFHRLAVTPQILRAWSEPARCVRFMQDQIQRARAFYGRSSELDDLVEPDCRPVLHTMTKIYSSLLERIARDPKRSALGKRVRLSFWQKAAIAVSAARAADRAGAAPASPRPAQPLETRG